MYGWLHLNQAKKAGCFVWENYVNLQGKREKNQQDVPFFFVPSLR